MQKLKKIRDENDGLFQLSLFNQFEQDNNKKVLGNMEASSEQKH